MFITVSQHARLSEAVRSLVHQVLPDDLDRPTPCAQWHVKALLEHMVGQDEGFIAALRNDVGVDAFAPRPLGAASGEAYATSSVAVTSAFGASDPDRQLLLPEIGPDARFPVHLAVDFHGLDVAVHGWDLAVSLGKEVDYAHDLVEATLAVARLVPDGSERTAPGALFGPVVQVGDDDDVSSWHRVLAVVGRDPRWQSTVSRRV
jgi:uncharacterized protein (TIGR03086 family)